ncbi:uncharacterized protein J4E88_008027 [Alternaria novae-zelandiae]|uniref:uncharacterized protein n=1 Tax=Alternaria novae-zelandiae TaxID=430562 RepID=UPI0020C295B0|nr:uncharacterized protein J4E88_008027 [Alternaria novae-zelandiae]KAI4675123.1 hypothetical protein J4E88_008027 [Alternaria novae-zelandiae]
MLKRKSEGAVDLERDTAPSGPSNELYSKSEMASSGDDAVDARTAHRIADLEQALAVAKEEQNLAREELSRLRQYREADQDTIEELRAQLTQSASNADTVSPAQLEERLASHDKTHQNRLERPQPNGEADDLRLRLHAAEKESQERLQQLLALKSSISSLTRMDSQITDSELAESFSQLANCVREWTVSNFRRSKLNLDNLPKETEEVLSALNPLYSVNIRSTDKLALYQAIVSNSLMQIFDAPVVFGLPSTGPFATLRPLAEHTRHLGTTYREWVRATVQILERSEASSAIETEREASLHRLTGEISHMLFTLTSVSLPSSAQSTLTGILKDAVGLQRTLALQKARYQLLFFRCQDASMQFDDRTMEAVNDVDPAVEDGADMDMDRRFLFCAFPGLVKWGNEWGEYAEMSNVLLKARVCSSVS